MEKTYKESLDMWELAAGQGHILHKVGSGEFPEMRRVLVKPSEVDMYEEVAVADIPPYTEAQYAAEVERLIRERYSVADELALINNVMSGATRERQAEYAAYQDYRAECKARAKEILTNKNVQDNE